MNVKRHSFLCVEIYKAINNLNPSFVEQIFLLGETNRSVREILNIPNLNILHTGTTLNLSVHLKRSPMKLFHQLYPLKKMASRLQFQELEKTDFPRKLMSKYYVMEASGPEIFFIFFKKIKM